MFPGGVKGKLLGGVIGAVIGGTSGAMLNKDPELAYLQASNEAMAMLQVKRQSLQDTLDKGLISQAKANEVRKQLAESEVAVEQNLVAKLAEIYKEKPSEETVGTQEWFPGMPIPKASEPKSPIPETLPFAGRSITRRQIEEAIQNPPKPKVVGDPFGYAHLEDDDMAALKEAERLRKQALREAEAERKRLIADQKRATEEALRSIESNEEKNLSEVEKIDQQRKARLASLAARGVNPQLLGLVDQSYGRLLGAAAKKQANEYRQAQQGFRNAMAESYVNFYRPSDEQFKEWDRNLAAEEQIRNIGFQATREGHLRQASRAVQLSELRAAPGDEVKAINEGYQIRLQLAEQLRIKNREVAKEDTDLAQYRIDLAKAEADFQKESQDARLEREIKIAQYQKQQLDQYKDAAGRVFDSLTAKGGGGLRDFFTGQLKTIERQLFVCGFLTMAIAIPN
jgi:hypothetical protein